jgi:hypothetical protein
VRVGLTLTTTDNYVVAVFPQSFIASTVTGTSMVYRLIGSFVTSGTPVVGSISIILTYNTNINISSTYFGYMIANMTALTTLGYIFTTTIQISGSVGTVVVPPNLLFYGLNGADMGYTQSTNLNVSFVYNESTASIISNSIISSYTLIEMTYMGCPTNSVANSNASFLPSDACLCSTGYYPNATSNICIKCLHECSTCTNFSGCLTCPSTRILSTGTCICLNGYYDDNVSY